MRAQPRVSPLSWQRRRALRAGATRRAATGRLCRAARRRFPRLRSRCSSRARAGLCRARERRSRTIGSPVPKPPSTMPATRSISRSWPGPTTGRPCPGVERVAGDRAHATVGPRRTVPLSRAAFVDVEVEAVAEGELAEAIIGRLISVGGCSPRPRPAARPEGSSPRRVATPLSAGSSDGRSGATRPCGISCPTSM